MNTADIVETAKMNARNAEIEFIKKYGEPFYCGSAWVEVQVQRTNSQIVKDLIELGFKKSHRPRILEISNWGGSKTQSLDVQEAGANKLADVLRYHGFKAQVRTWAN